MPALPLSVPQELRALLRLAGPLVASQLAHMLMMLTDTLMMARISPLALAGGSLGAASYGFISTFCLGVIAAVGTLASIRRGAGDARGVARLTQAGLWLGGLLACAAALLLWNLPPLLSQLGQAPENVAGAREFLRWLPLALPGLFSFMALRGFTSAMGHASPVLVISIGAVVVNYGLNHALIEGLFGLPAMGLAGIGMVTAIVSSSMALLLAGYIRRQPRFAPYPLLRGLARPSWSDLAELWRLGLPIGGTYAVEAGLFAFSALCVGSLGSVELGAHQIALQIVAVAFMVPSGLSYAVTLRVGQHYGAGDWHAARRAGRIAITGGACLMLSFSALFWLFPRAIIERFLDANDPAFVPVIELAISLLGIAAWFELFDGTQSIAMGALRGLKASRTSFVIGLGCYWLVGAPLVWLLGISAGWGAEAVWWGLAAGLAFAASLLSLGFEWRIGQLRPITPVPVAPGLGPETGSPSVQPAAKAC